ncbi:hypothetical protein ISN44_As11g006390 [Arabidopsis suecica]|uniref:Uncharacterized protein n=1 Tax=Arabidopsis suecica TaxID=45249 RepID=A0A8T1Z5P2_ARASU|nr:hypothetical protein ISN44_As11g006390 [Arabidopsis suecica]
MLKPNHIEVRYGKLLGLKLSFSLPLSTGAGEIPDQHNLDYCDELNTISTTATTTTGSSVSISRITPANIRTRSLIRVITLLRRFHRVLAVVAA